MGPPEPLENCETALDDAGVRYKAARIGVGRKVDGIYTCGAHQVVRYKGGPGKIDYGGSPTMTCQMALAMADFETVVQEEAERHLGSRVKSIKHLGTYNCRKMANYDWISEHSFANGIDIATYTLRNGKTVSVLKDFEPTVDDADASDKAMFMRAVARRLYDEDVFSNVLTPYFDRLHRNHMHVDLARYRTDGTRP